MLGQYFFQCVAFLRRIRFYFSLFLTALFLGFFCAKKSPQCGENFQQTPLQIRNHVGLGKQKRGLKRVLAIALDADGCIFHKEVLRQLQKQAQNHPFNGLEAQLLAVDGNGAIFKHFAQKIQQTNYDVICFLISSWRQTTAIDMCNAKMVGRTQTPLFFDVMPLLVQRLQENHPQLAGKIWFDPFLLPDAKHNKTPGTCYREREHFCGDWGDEIHHHQGAKNLILVHHKSYLRGQFPNAIIDYCVYDDYPELYDLAAKEIKAEPKFRISLYKYVGDAPECIDARAVA